MEERVCVTDPEPRLTEEEEEERLTCKRSLRPLYAKIGVYVAIAMTAFQLYTAYFGIYTSFRQRGAHLLFALILCFILYSGTKNKKDCVPWYDWMLIGLAAFSYGYMIYFAHPLSSRHMLVTNLSPVQLAVGILGILVLVEGCRRALGYAFTSIIVVSLLYAMWGNLLTGLLRHRGFTLMWTVDHIFFTWEGVFGIPLAVSATYVFIFIAFAHFLKYTGAGDFFINLAIAGMGRYRGGPAKTAVLASGLMGSVSGSAVANVVATGSITIPLMKKIGYSAHFAGAVEAVASTGGQLMPPVMGAAAFIMSEFTGIPYLQIVLAAIIPAILYYLGVSFQVHFEAVKIGLTGMKKEELPNFKLVFLRGVHYFIPIIVIFYFLTSGYSPLYAGLFALVSVLIVSAFRKHSRITVPKFLNAMESAGKGAVEVAIACAGAGIVVGVVSLTGIGIRFSTLIIRLSGGELLPALILTMMVAVVLGMGLPPVAAYIVQAALLAPALVQLGVPMLAAHMFCFYFSILSNITPPVALAAYAAGAVAGADPFKTGYTAMRLGIAAYIVPYMFVYGPALLLQGSTPVEIIVAFVTALVGVYALAVASVGYYRIKLVIVERLLFAAAALLLISASVFYDAIGFVAIALGIGLHIIRSKKVEADAAAKA